jgi:hypothetical protein
MNGQPLPVHPKNRKGRLFGEIMIFRGQMTSYSRPFSYAPPFPREMNSNNDENNPWPPPPRQETAAPEPPRRRTVNFGCLGLLFAAGSVAIFLIGDRVAFTILVQFSPLPSKEIDRKVFWVEIVTLLLSGIIAASGLLLSLRERSKPLAIVAVVICGIIGLFCLVDLLIGFLQRAPG